MALCFVGFSTFKARSLLNIHDLTVHSDFRNQGIGERLLSAAILYARQSGFCAVTLEVQASNPARRLYARQGFQSLDGEHNDAATLFGKLEIH